MSDAAASFPSQGRLALAWRRQARRAPHVRNAHPRRIAHRGFAGCCPENTLAACRFCLGRADMVELDLRLTSDDHVVIHHDDTPARACVSAPDASLLACRVDRLPLARLRALDMGGREPVPTLTEVLAWAKRHAMPLNLELKGQGSPARDALLVRTTIHHVSAFGMTDKALLSSFHPGILAECLRRAPRISRALILAGPPPADLVNTLTALSACACHPEHHDVNADLVRRLRAAGFFVNVWTVNEPERQRELAALGVDGLIGDFPAECLSVAAHAPSVV